MENIDLKTFSLILFDTTSPPVSPITSGSSLAFQLLSRVEVYLNTAGRADASRSAVAPDVQAEQSTDEEKNGCDKGKCLCSLPLRTAAVTVSGSNIAPRKGAAAVDFPEPVDQQSKSLLDPKSVS
jgi:hypothetical protein